MVDLKYDVLWNDHGAPTDAAKFAKSLAGVTRETKQAQDSQLKLAQAEIRGREAARQLEQAQAKLTKVQATGTASAEQEAKAQLAVDRAQLKVAQSTVAHQRATEELAVATETTNKSSGLAVGKLTGLKVAAAGGALAFGAIVGAAAGFDKQLSNVQAVSGATADELGKLREAALQAGADTAFSAGEAAQAEGELAKAGVTTSDILGGALTGALSLAAAGQLNLGDAASIAAQTMTIFKLNGQDVSHIADVLAAAANKSTADVSGLGTSLTYAGSTAAAMGLSLEDTVGVLALFSNHAINGSEAGTGLRGVLAGLAKPSTEAANQMDSVGLSAFDAGGKFVGLANFAQQLHDKLGPLTQAQREQALVTIFGRETLGAATALYEEGGEGVKNYTAAVNENGAATNVAATNLNNLAGDLDALKGSLETAFITTGEHANGVLRTMAQYATKAVNAFAALPAPVQQGAIGLIGLGTAVAGALAAFGAIAPKITAARTSLEGMGRAGQVANRAVGILGRSVGVGIPLIAAATAVWEIHAHQQQESQAHVESLTAAIKEDSGALGDNTRATIVDTLEKKGALKAGQDMGLSTKTLTDAVLGNADAQRQVSEALKSGKGDRFAVIAAISTEMTAVKEGTEAAKRKAEAEGKGADATKKMSDAADTGWKSQRDLNTGLQATNKSLEDQLSLSDQVALGIDKLNKSATDAATTNLAFLSSEHGVTEAIKDNGRTLDGNTEKGRANLTAIFGAIKAAEEHARAVAEQTGSVEKGNRVFRDNIATLRSTLIQSGLTRGEVDRLLATYARTPKNVRTKAELEAAQAKADLKDYRTRLDALQRKINGLHGKTLVVDVNAYGIAQVQREVDSITGHVVSVKVGTRGPERRAVGGPVQAGQPYLVGEHGPELLVPHASGMIIPGKGGSGRGGGFGSTYNISVNVAPGAHPADIGAQLVQLIRSYEQRSGAGWRG